MASGFVWALRYFSWRYLLHGIQCEKPATLIYEPSPSSGLLLRMLCWQMTYETKKMWSYIWNLKKRSWFLTNQSSVLELQGAIHLFSNLSVGIPQLACFAWDYLIRWLSNRDYWDNDGNISYSSCKMTNTIGPLPSHGEMILPDVGRMLIWDCDLAQVMKFQELNTFQLKQFQRIKAL